jgi:hypothetical protein
MVCPKQAEHATTGREMLSAAWPGPPLVVVRAELFRDPLLVEVDGTAGG